MPAISGFVLYKTFQTASGGSVEIALPSSKDGKLSSVQFLPNAASIAIWPSSQGSVMLAERLIKAGKSITAPGSVSALLASQRLPTDLTLMTEAEQGEGFAAVCQGTNAELVLASRDRGESTERNMLSFSRAAVTHRFDLLGYSCSQRRIVWRDELAANVPLGGTTPSMTEIHQAAADAWADRILEAMRVAPRS